VNISGVAFAETIVNLPEAALPELLGTGSGPLVEAQGVIQGAFRSAQPGSPKAQVKAALSPSRTKPDLAEQKISCN
jgi:hypothetical protein